MTLSWPLPKNDPWSTPFAEVLLEHLDIFSGASILDIASGGGIPAFNLAEKVGPKGKVLAIDIHPSQILRARSILGSKMPWLEFEIGDMKNLPPTLPSFDRITGNLSFMFFRPNRYEVLKQLIKFLKPEGQVVLTFPSHGTFDSLWKRVDKEMKCMGLNKERKSLNEYIEERPSSNQAKKWLKELGMEKVVATERPLEVESGSGREFLEHPLLRGGFLDDVYECFEDQALANKFMTIISNDLPNFKPLVAKRCAMSGWMPKATSKV